LLTLERLQELDRDFDVAITLKKNEVADYSSVGIEAARCSGDVVFPQKC